MLENIGRITKRRGGGEDAGGMSKRSEETTRALGRMTKRGKLSKMKGEDDSEEPWLQVVCPGSQWFNGDITDQWPNGWGRVSKRATRKRSGPGGRFIRIGMAGEDVDGSKEMKLMKA